MKATRKKLMREKAVRFQRTGPPPKRITLKGARRV
jgi:hypothetical protein